MNAQQLIPCLNMTFKAAVGHIYIVTPNNRYWRVTFSIDIRTPIRLFALLQILTAISLYLAVQANIQGFKQMGKTCWGSVGKSFGMGSGGKYFTFTFQQTII